MVKSRSLFITLLMFTVLEGIQYSQCQKLNQRTFRPMFLQAVRKCYAGYKPPEGAAITFFTMPEMTHHTTKCFTKCILNSFELIDSNGNFQNESLQPFFNSLPESRFRSSLERNLDSCLQERSDELCEKSFKFVQCFYKRALSLDPGQQTENPKKANISKDL